MLNFIFYLFIVVVNLKPKIDLSSADEVRDKITATQIKNIKLMFSNLSKEAKEKAKKLEGKNNVSSLIEKKYLEDLAKELEKQLDADFKNLKNNFLTRPEFLFKGTAHRGRDTVTCKPVCTKAFKQGMECRAMVVMTQMAQLVQDDIVPQMLRHTH